MTDFQKFQLVTLRICVRDTTSALLLEKVRFHSYQDVAPLKTGPPDRFILTPGL
jgi:hypothetical protein